MTGGREGEMAGRRVVVYEKPTCSTCRNLFKVLTEKGIDFEKVEYLIDPPSREKLAELVRKMNGSVRDIIRSKEPEYEELGVQSMDDEEILDTIARHPNLLQRPIVEIDDRAIVARPAERVNEIL